MKLRLRGARCNENKVNCTISQPVQIAKKTPPPISTGFLNLTLCREIRSVVSRNNTRQRANASQRATKSQKYVKPGIIDSSQFAKGSNRLVANTAAKSTFTNVIAAPHIPSLKTKATQTAKTTSNRAIIIGLETARVLVSGFLTF